MESEKIRMLLSEKDLLLKNKLKDSEIAEDKNSETQINNIVPEVIKEEKQSDLEPEIKQEESVIEEKKDQIPEQPTISENSEQVVTKKRKKEIFI